jgi:DNA processing protein
MSGPPCRSGSGALPEAAYAAALACLPGVGPAWLVDVLGRRSPERAWAMVLAGELERQARPGPRPPAPGWREAAQRVDVGGLWARCLRHGVQVTWPGQPCYPSAFAEGPAPPGVLFSAGRAGTLESRPCVAIVGTRRCTPDGAAAAYQLSYDLSIVGVCVVSGLALGIDGAAHAGALAAVRDLENSDAGGGPRAGSTVGVAASGVDVVYPRHHRGLWKEVVALGAVVSETPPGWPAQAWRFPSRNRLIAGFARILVVVECHASGGSWHTVEWALRRGTEVGAIPGPIHSSASVGTNTLLHEGATPIRCAQDVLDALGMFDGPGTGGAMAPGAGRFGDYRARRGVARPEGAGGLGSGRGVPVDGAPPPRAPAASATPRAARPPRAEAHALPLAAGKPVKAPLSALEERVRAALGWRPLCLEEIVERSGLPTGAVVVALDQLEDEGLAGAEAGWWYRKAP